jgi:hypothetical protein
MDSECEVIRETYAVESVHRATGAPAMRRFGAAKAIGSERRSVGLQNYRYRTGTGPVYTGTGTVPVRGETSSGRARCALVSTLVGRDGCEVRLCEPCAHCV